MSICHIPLNHQVQKWLHQATNTAAREAAALAQDGNPQEKMQKGGQSNYQLFYMFVYDMIVCNIIYQQIIST